MARTETWTPADPLLFALPETAESISYGISVVVEDNPGPSPTVTGYSASISPAQSVLSLETSPSGVTVSADSLAGLFPVQFIDYLLGGVLSRANSWGEVPVEAEDIIEYRPSYDISVEYTLTITADLSDSTQVSKAYTLQITQDWDAGKAILEAEVDARR